MLIGAADALFSVRHQLSGPAFQAAIAWTLFWIALSYIFWQAYRLSAAVITTEALFVYPLTLRWREVSVVSGFHWGIQVNTKPGGPRNILLLRVFYQIQSDDLPFLQGLATSAA
jgi:hypothetical protein